MLVDALKITANLPTLAATIYNLKYRDGAEAIPDPDLDWSANFAHMIGKGDDPDYKDLCRLFMTLHSDQESGNASAHTSHLVSSTLSDLYLSSSAGLNALADRCMGWLTRKPCAGCRPCRSNTAACPVTRNCAILLWRHSSRVW